MKMVFCVSYKYWYYSVCVCVCLSVCVCVCVCGYLYLVLSNIFQRLLNSFVQRLFTVKSFDVDFPLASNIDGMKDKCIKMPEGIR